MTDNNNDGAAPAAENTPAATPKTKSGRPIPPWFKPKNWLEADVDLSAFGLGIVHLRDATFERQAAWYAAQQENDGVTVDGRAKMFAAYVDRSEVSGMPGPRANAEQWTPWVKQQRAKVVARLAAAIYLFQEHLEAESETAPNGSGAS